MIFVYPQENYFQDISVKSFPLDYISVEQLLPVIQQFLTINGSAIAVASDAKDNRKTTESVVIVQVLTGQFYLAVIVARLVGLVISKSQS